MNLYIGADLGTSGLKLLLVDTCGKVLNSVAKNYDVYYPNSGWSEQNPDGLKITKKKTLIKSIIMLPKDYIAYR